MCPVVSDLAAAAAATTDDDITVVHVCAGFRSLKFTHSLLMLIFISSASQLWVC